MSPTSPHDDRQLFDRFHQGNDPSALALLVERNLPLVYSVALRITGQPQLAEEVGQDVFLKLVQKPPALMKGIPLAAWLHRTTRSRAIDLLRSERSRTAREKALQESPDVGPMLDEEALALVDEVIDRLPDGERRVVVGRFFLGQSFAALSAEVGATEDAVRMRLNRALEKMRQAFSRRGITTSAAILAQALPAQAVVAPPGALAAAILKSISAAGTTAGAAFSLTNYLIIMTTAKKSTIAACLLLATTIPTVLYVRHRGEEAKKTGLREPSSAAASPQAPPVSGERPTRMSRKEPDAEFAALAAKYGETEARQAQALASQSAARLRDITSDKLMAQTGTMVGGQMKALSGILKLTPEQDEFIMGQQAEVVTGHGKQMKEVAERVGQNLPALAEFFLAVDALSRGTIDEVAYQEVLRSKTPALSSGNLRAWDLLGLVGMKEVYKAEDPFADMPEAAASFAAQLDPEQQREYQDIRDTNAAHAAEIPKIDGKDLGGLSTNVAGLSKMVEAMELMNPEKLGPAK